VQAGCQFRLKAPVRAILDNPEEEYFVELPVGAVVGTSTQPSTTLLGAVGVYWEERHYSVDLAELVKSADLISPEDT
jgi:hypothetical protein